MEQGTMTVKQMAEYLHIGMNVAYKLIKRPGFPAVWLSPQRVVIPFRLLNKWLEDNATDKGGDADE